MPDYNFTIKVPKNTARDQPVKTELELMKGIIAGGQIFFPAGCQGLAHVTINDSLGQLYPANAADTFHGDNGSIPLVGRHLLDSSPFKLSAYAWNEDDTYDHTIQITVNLLTPEEVNLSLVMLKLLDVLNIIKQLLTGRRVS
jgi:hypothetical protein